MRTWLTERFGLTVPVVCAPMAGVAGGRLAGAVSAAGALGMIGVGAGDTPEWLVAQAEPAAPGGAFGIGLQAWVLERSPEQLDAALAAGPVLVSVSYGDYGRWLRRIHDAGLPVATTVATVKEARAAEAAGVDLLVARGREGGGHGRDAVGTLPLLQAVLDAVDVPVLAAGGVANARGLAAVLAAGAAGAWAGTAFLSCEEAATTAAARARLDEATETDTVYTRVFDVAARAGWPAEFGERVLRNGFQDRWAGREAELGAGGGPAAEFARATAVEDFDVACLDAGQGVGLLRAEATAATVVAQFARAEHHLRRAAGDPTTVRDRTPGGRPRQARPRDALGRPLPYGHPDGVEQVSEEPLPPPQALATAQTLLDGGRAFSAHEVLEAAWKAAPSHERDLWQGLAQLCVAITHAHRGNPAGAGTLLRRAEQHLGGYVGGGPHDIDVAGLLVWCRQFPDGLTTTPPRLRSDGTTPVDRDR